MKNKVQGGRRWKLVRSRGWFSPCSRGSARTRFILFSTVTQQTYICVAVEFTGKRLHHMYPPDLQDPRPSLQVPRVFPTGTCLSGCCTSRRPCCRSRSASCTPPSPFFGSCVSPDGCRDKHEEGGVLKYDGRVQRVIVVPAFPVGIGHVQVFQTTRRRSPSLRRTSPHKLRLTEKSQWWMGFVQHIMCLNCRK